MATVIQTEKKSLVLEPARALFSRFSQDGIRYCHFKSNEHLVPGLTGKTDLDILVDRRQAQSVELALLQTGFQRFVPAIGYPSIEDYLGFDNASGSLLHVQIHFNLVVGEKDLKGLNLDFGERILRTRIVDSETDVYVSEPNHELFLLIVRAAVKIRWRDMVAALLGRNRVDGQMAREFRWLAERTEVEKVAEIAARELGPEAAALIVDLAAGPPTIWKLRAFRSRIRRALSWYRVYAPVERQIVRFIRRLLRLAGGFNARYLHLPVAFRRTHRAGGCVVAFVGMDGAGKSTISRQVLKWLTWKLDVYPVYFGSGMGKSSMLRWPMKVVLKGLRKARLVRGRRKVAQSSDAGDLGRRRRVTWAVALWALSLALEKKAKLKRIHRARSRGMIVLCDRYPQIHVAGFNDGPLLEAWIESPSRLRRSLARWEHGIYERATMLHPDLVIKLDLPPEVAAGRQSETSIDDLYRRRQVVRGMDYGDGCGHVEIDASATPDVVLLNVKRAIWERC